jgi:hypothetical protein
MGSVGSLGSWFGSIGSRFRSGSVGSPGPIGRPIRRATSSERLVRRVRGPQVLDEVRRRLRCAFAETEEPHTLTIVETPPIRRVLQPIEDFLELAVGEAEVANEIVRQVSPESLRDVAGSVAGGALQLLAQILMTSQRITFDQTVDLQLEFVSQLPADKFCVRSDTRHEE